VNKLNQYDCTKQWRVGFPVESWVVIQKRTRDILTYYSANKNEGELSREELGRGLSVAHFHFSCTDKILLADNTEKPANKKDFNKET